MADGFAIEGECNKCGATTFSVPDNATDDTRSRCAACGESIGTFGALKAEIMGIATPMAKKTFRKIKGFKPR